MKKKYLIKQLLTIIILALSFVILCCCNSKKPAKTEGTLTLSVENVTFAPGSEYKILGFVNDEEVECEYETTNQSVVAIRENGNIVARNEGNAQVIISYKSLKATCDVSVNSGDNVATFELDASYDGKAQIDMLNGVALTGKIYFNGNVYADNINYTYELSDKNVGSIDNNIFLPIKTGKCNVDVTAEWFGQVCNTTIEISVVDNVLLTINGNPVVEEVEMYAVEEFDGITYDNTKDFDVKITNGGSEVPVNVTVDDETVVEFKNGKIYAKKGGKTFINVVAEQENFYYETSVEVLVNVPVADYDVKIVNFSALDGDLIDQNDVNVLSTYFNENNALVSANERGAKLDVSTNKILGVETSKEGLTTTAITVYGEKFGYNFKVEGYTKILSKPEDIMSLNVTKGGTTLSGYFLLKNDIDITGRKDILNNLNNGGWDIFQSSYFSGVFDGNGKKIIGYSMGVNGLFGRLDKATVKDLSLTNVVMPNDAVRAFVFGRVCAFSMPTTIQNCYVSILFDAGNFSKNYGIFGERNSKNLTVMNFIMEQNITSEVTMAEDNGNGLFMLNDVSRGWATFDKFYVIAPENEFGRIMTLYQSKKLTIYAKNEVTDIVDGTIVKITVSNKRNPSISQDGSGRTLYHYNVLHYFSVSDLINSGVQRVGNFDLSSGKVVFSK